MAAGTKSYRTYKFSTKLVNTENTCRNWEKLVKTGKSLSPIRQRMNPLDKILPCILSSILCDLNGLSPTTDTPMDRAIDSYVTGNSNPLIHATMPLNARAKSNVSSSCHPYNCSKNTYHPTAWK